MLHESYRIVRIPMANESWRGAMRYARFRNDFTGSLVVGVGCLKVTSSPKCENTDQP